MSTLEWKEAITEMCHAGVTHFSLTGGESLLRNDWAELIAFTAEQRVLITERSDAGLIEKEIHPRINLLTNGKLMSETVLDVCEQYNVNLSISLPGLESYAHHTQSDTPVVSILKWFQRANSRHITTTAGITVTAFNFHELKETLSMALIAGANTILLNRFLPGGRGLSHPELELSQTQIIEMAIIAEKVLHRAGRYGGIGTEFPVCLLPENQTFKHLQMNTRCGAAESFFIIGPSGHLRVCNHSPVELAHWRDWRSVKDDPYWRKFVFKEFIPEMCHDCESLSQCDGGCREAAHICFGSPNAPDPALTKMKQHSQKKS